MLNQLPTKFFQGNDCGCGCGGNSTPSMPQQAVICDDRYYTTIVSPRTRLLGVVPGSNCQTFLEKGVGFVMDDGTGLGAFVAKRPTWDLPLLNPLSSGAYPLPSGFPFLVMATGDLSNTPWGFVRAPSSGAYVLQVENGQFVLKDAGQIPGLNSVCSQTISATMVFLSGCAPTGSVDGSGNPIYALKKLLARPNAPVVGVTNPDSSVGFESLSYTDPFKHPTMQPDKMNCETFVQRDPASDIEETGGLPVLPRTGPTAPGDAVPGYYSPTTKKFYRAPAHVRANLHQQTPTTISLNGTYQAISGHLNFGAIDFQYPNVEITWNAQTNTAERINWGLYKDGTLIKEWRYAGTYTGSPTVVGGTFIVTAVTPGSHTFEIRAQGTTGSCAVEFSSATAKTLTD